MTNIRVVDTVAMVPGASSGIGLSTAELSFSGRRAGRDLQP
jgi:NADP-dependent 3-hydroxy acid dehydrogenase YdfG